MIMCIWEKSILSFFFACLTFQKTCAEIHTFGNRLFLMSQRVLIPHCIFQRLVTALPARCSFLPLDHLFLSPYQTCGWYNKPSVLAGSIEFRKWVLMTFKNKKNKTSIWPNPFSNMLLSNWVAILEPFAVAEHLHVCIFIRSPTADCFLCLCLQSFKPSFKQKEKKSKHMFSAHSKMHRPYYSKSLVLSLWPQAAYCHPHQLIASGTYCLTQSYSVYQVSRWSSVTGKNVT